MLLYFNSVKVLATKDGERQQQYMFKFMLTILAAVAEMKCELTAELIRERGGQEAEIRGQVRVYERVFKQGALNNVRSG